MLRPQRQETKRFLDLTKLAVTLFAQETVAGKLWIVEETRIRIRPYETES